MIYSIQNILVLVLGGFVSFLMSLAFMAPSVFMHNKLAISLWGKFESKQEVRKFAFLAIIFCFIIGIYWALRPLKDGIFGDYLHWGTYQPWAKMLSLVVIVPLIIFYNKLIDMYPRNKLFYILTSAYGLTALLFAAVFLSPYGIGATGAAKAAFLRPAIGWAWYVYVESFGSLLVALFWAFTSDITKPGAARRGFPMIALLGQMGNILGPKYLNAKELGFASSAPVVIILAGLIFGIGLLLWLFIKVTPQDQMTGFEAVITEDIKKDLKEEAGFLDGLKHLLRHKYLLGIAAIIIFYEVIVTMVDFVFFDSCCICFSNKHCDKNPNAD